MLRRALAAIAMLAVASACASASDGGVTRLDRNAAYPEGPLWRDGRLYVAEMGADRVSVFENGAKRTYWSQPGCGPTAIAPYGDGFLILCHLAAEIVAVDANARVRFARDADDAGAPFRDPNDCYEDGVGGVYFSDPGIFSKETRPHGDLVHIDARGHVVRVVHDLWYPNGVYVDRAHGQLYLSETFRRRVLRYPLAADGTLAGEASVFFDVDRDAPADQRFTPPYREAGPDGLEMAPDGAMYVAIYGEGRILRIGPNGAYEGEIDEPMRYLTNIAFDPAGDAYTTGAYDNETPPFPGEVRQHALASLPGPR